MVYCLTEMDCEVSRAFSHINDRNVAIFVSRTGPRFLHSEGSLHYSRPNDSHLYPTVHLLLS
jgi:hypothetical protein